MSRFDRGGWRAAPLALALLAALATARPALAAQAADPFYTALLRDGTQSLARNQHEAAAGELRLACFGLLEQTALLGECLTRLALAQAGLGERDDFLATFRRLEEVEERFGGYTAAALTPAERGAFEDRVVEWVPPEILRTIPRFAAAAARREAAELAALPEGRRLRELERRAEAEPGEPRWRIALAEHELGRGRAAAALQHLRGVPAEAEGGQAGCLAGRALAALDRCAETPAAFAACPAAGSDPVLVEPRLRCLIELQRLTEARALLAAAPRATAERPAIAHLAARLEPAAAPPTTTAPEKSAAPDAQKSPTRPAERRPRGAPATAMADAAPATAPAASPAPEQAPPAAPGAAPSTPPALDQARERMRTATTRSELEAALALAQPLAEAHPDRVEVHLLIGEIAYRASNWRACAAAYRRAGASGPADPTQRFYLAVCLYESGERAAASEVAATGLERLPRTPFVDSYLRKLAPSP